MTLPTWSTTNTNPYVNAQTLTSANDEIAIALVLYNRVDMFCAYPVKLDKDEFEIQ